MQIGIPREIQDNENRVSATPKTVELLIKQGFTFLVEKNAGAKASFSDQLFSDAGAEISASASDVLASDIIFKVNAPTIAEIEQIKEGATLVSFIWPAQNPELLKLLEAKNISVIAMDSVPRTSRAQALDALSSMANIAGYRAVIESANQFGRFFTGQITAAGKVPPAKVLIIGAGVAGLAALGAAGSLGAIVRAFDTRPEVKEQVESMGAEFLEVNYQDEEEVSSDGYAKTMSKGYQEAQAAMMAEQAKEVDIIITTALIPGKPAPKLISEEMIKSMKAGSVIVDLAAAAGGNAALTVKDEVFTSENGVKIIGFTDLPSRLPTQSSQLYATNLVNLMKLLCKNKDGQIDIDFEDEVIRGATVVKEGEISWPPPAIKVSAAPAPKAEEVKEAVVAVEEKAPNKWIKPVAAVVAAGLFGWLATVAPTEFLAHFTVFMLACIVGYGVVWNVAHSLHTPLMSVTNAISGIIIIGALLQVGSDNAVVTVLSTIAILIATINIVGGFTVTHRMLKMFQKDK